MMATFMVAAVLQAAAPPIPDLPILGSATASPDCGGLYGLAGRAFCVTTPLAGIDPLASAYVDHLERQGWIAADGAENRVIFVRRREGGGCDGLQMMAFYDTSKPAAEQSPGYLGFGIVPGDICAPASAAPAAPAAPPAQ